MTHAQREAVGRTLAVLFAVLGFVGAFAPTAAASPAPPGPSMEVEAGLRGWHDVGDHVVVTARISSDVLFSGRVDVVSSSGMTVTRDVQVAGGTTKTVQLVAPTGFDASSVDVRLYRDSDLVTRRSVSLKIAEGVELVGVLPALATRAGRFPDQVTLATGTGKAQVAELQPEVMALGTAALDVYDTIVATSADLRSLQPTQRSALLGWLNGGGRLLLDDAGDLSALPQEWRPGTAGYAIAGSGEVHLVEGEASAGRWATMLQPSGAANSETNGFFGFETTGDLQGELARRSGVKLPRLTPLLVPLIGYWALVSIVLFFVLRTVRRMTFAWVAIPLLALGTAGGVAAYGNQWRAAGRPTASVFVDGYPGGGDALLTVLTFSRSGGTATVEMPSGWQSDSELAGFFGGFDTSIKPRVTSTAEGARLSVRLEAGQLTTATVTGPTTDIGLRATAEARGTDVVGEVTNGGPVALVDVVVFGPGGAAEIGALAPGETKPFTIDADPLPAGFGLAERVWRAPGEAGATHVPELGIWAYAGATRIMYPSAMVRVAGWTDERPGDASVPGGLITRTVVTSLARILPGAAPLPAACVRFSLVRSPFTAFGDGTEDSVYRFVLPPETRRGARLVMQLPVGLNSIELWNGSGWARSTAKQRILTLPAAALQRGVVMARIPNDGTFFPGDQSPLIRAATAEDPS